MTIGEVARKTGLRSSAIRFYERAGVLPNPVRTSGQRRYDDRIFDRIAVLERAKDCGFTLTEIGILFNSHGRHSVKWRGIAEKKIAELDAALARIQAMKDLLQRGCECATADECGRRIRESRKPKYSAKC
jgi:MerR family transcriptional regulator, redox-sensitive transcriptional activator SoxR